MFRSFKVNQTNDLRRDFQKVKNKRNLSLKSFKANQSLKKFQEILIESLASYTKNKVKISVTLQNLNRYKRLSHAQIKNLIVIFKQLKKFVRNSFFKEAINILFITVTKRKSAKLLAEFISDQFRLNQLRSDQIAISRKLLFLEVHLTGKLLGNTFRKSGKLENSRLSFPQTEG